MKKLVFLILLFAAPCFADNGATFYGSGHGVAAAGGGGCPTGTYLAIWDGTHSSGDEYICYNNGASTKAGTQSGGTLATTYTVTAADQYVKWAVATDDLMQDFPLTIWVRLQVASFPAAETTVWMSRANVNYGLSLTLLSTGKVFCNAEINGVKDISSWTGAAISTGVDQWIGLSIDTNGDFSAGVNDSWEADLADTGTTAWDPDDFYIGEDDAEEGAGSATIVVKEVQSFGTYQASRIVH